MALIVVVGLKGPATSSSTHLLPRLTDATTEVKETRRPLHDERAAERPVANSAGCRRAWHVVITAATALVDMLWSFGSQSQRSQQSWVVPVRLVNMTCQSQQTNLELMSELWCQTSATRKLKVTLSHTNWLMAENQLKNHLFNRQFKYFSKRNHNTCPV